MQIASMSARRGLSSVWWLAGLLTTKMLYQHIFSVFQIIAINAMQLNYDDDDNDMFCPLSGGCPDCWVEGGFDYNTLLIPACATVYQVAILLQIILIICQRQDCSEPPCNGVLHSNLQVHNKPNDISLFEEKICVLLSNMGEREMFALSGSHPDAILGLISLPDKRGGGQRVSPRQRCKKRQICFHPKAVLIFWTMHGQEQES